MPPSQLTVGSLFSGIGGIDLAFQRSGFTIAWQVEIDPAAQTCLRTHSRASPSTRTSVL